MSKFPSIPTSQDKNVKLFLDSLAGRMGEENRVVTMSDLIRTGIIDETIFNALVIDESTEVPTVDPAYVPSLPTIPKNLGVAGSWANIFLTWEYTAYNSEQGTEIWRSNSNDIDTAELIGVASGRFYSDNVGAKVSKYYWVRNRNINGVVSGYNQVDGVEGISNLQTTAGDFILRNSDLDTIGQPFNAVNFGTDLNPDWKMLLTGETVIESDLSIGQLTTGEMRPNSKFTVGNGSIEIGTDNSGKGYMTVTGDGGTSENDYLFLNAGTLKTFIYDNAIGEHVEYKELKRVERGVVTSGNQAVIPAYFKSTPIVSLSFEDILVYNPDWSAQSQSLKMDVGSVEPHPTVTGSYIFTPTAVLAKADGFETVVEPLDSGETSTDSWQLDSTNTFVNGKRFQVTFTVSSAKNYNSSNYKNRQILITLQGSLNSGAYSTLATFNVELSGSGVSETVVVDSGVVTQGDWQLRYLFAASDRTGTEPSGGEVWEYYNDGDGQYPTITTGNLFDIETDTINLSLSDMVQCTAPSIDTSEWELYKINYSFDYDFKVESWNVNKSTQVLPVTNKRESSGFGTASGNVPSGMSASLSSVFNSLSTYPKSTCDGFSDAGVHNLNGYKLSEASSQTIDISENVTNSSVRAMYLDGRYTNSNCEVNGSSMTATNYPYCTIGMGQARIKINSYNVKYYFRKPTSVNLTAVNRYKSDSVAADLGASDDAIQGAVINWIAIGE